MYARMDTVRCLESTWQHNKPNGHRLHELGVERKYCLARLSDNVSDKTLYIGKMKR